MSPAGKKSFSSRRFMLLTAMAALSACSAFDTDDKKPLPGERVSVLELQGHIEPDSSVLNAEGFVAPAPWRNEFWPQTGGYPNHVMQNLALSEGELKPAWSVKIGHGSSDELPLTAQPVVVDGRVFAMDARHTLSAFSAVDGKKLWTFDVGKPGEDDPVIGGGIAYSKGYLYVTAGYDEILALSPVDGALLWRVRIPAPARAAPTIMDDRVFVSLLDNRLVALSAADGSFLWDFTGVSELSGLIGAASPAAGRETVIPAFSSGELFALRVENGSMAWAENLSAFRPVGGVGGLSDIHGLPVIDKGMVIAISFGGKMAAIDERTGNRVWQRDIGGAETPWVAGNHVFVLSGDGDLVALGRDDGSINWVTSLPRFEDQKDRDDPIFWTGPVLAGGRLIVAGSNGVAVDVAPDSGKVIRTWKTGRNVATPPVVAGETLYLLGEDGTLMAYR